MIAGRREARDPEPSRRNGRGGRRKPPLRRESGEREGIKEPPDPYKTEESIEIAGPSAGLGPLTTHGGPLVKPYWGAGSDEGTPGGRNCQRVLRGAPGNEEGLTSPGILDGLHQGVGVGTAPAPGGVIE
ncbi:hypothetical protein NDU88_004084 [Pleurodeles waltl]|uniref:Uncharacterized protein n=1 Tax=Pleurodeles waltl TaxID=8319 RepID=A0AAV7SHR0_PLEWA|nr:hypothetical protein NDU88_004084 [Pleurodeles waltl]